jgi:enoyl-CoA hydratase/carnithine racemase
MPFRYTKEGGIATITLDNPPVNVLTPEQHRELHAILSDFAADPAVRVGIWTGAGERSWCAGDDVKTERPVRSTAEVVERHLSLRRDGDSDEYPGWETQILRLSRVKPMIAAVNGYCLGQGMIYLVMLTDLRIAADTARFGLPEIAYGMPGAAAVARLGRHIAPADALWLALTGDMIDAAEARRMHLVNEVVPAAALMDRARAVALRIAEHPPLAVRAEMEAFHRSLDLSRDDAMAFAGHLYHLIRATQDRSILPLARKEKSE